MSKPETIPNTFINTTLTRTVSIFISSQLFKLTGGWQWNLNSAAIYCSDVISFPNEFEGTKAILHPDDIADIKEKLVLIQQGVKVDFDFRIITTYGVVEKLIGSEIRIIENDDNPVWPWLEEFEKVNYQNQLTSSLFNAELIGILNNYTDKINMTGGWYINIDTLETWFSDNVFRIYGLQPQSLNNHFYTFSNFLHPDDREAVISAFDHAFLNRVPLHLDFRIITPDSKVKNVRINTYWGRIKSGQEFLFGLIKDETEQESSKKLLRNIELELHIQKKLLLIDEEEINIGHFDINIETRKTYFSDSFFKLFGIKSPLILTNFNYFIDFIHPDDRQKVKNEFERIIKERINSGIEFRVIRADGKIKYLKLKTKLITVEGDLIMAGVLRDITLSRLTEKKLKEYIESVNLTQVVLKKLEEITKTGSWSWNLKTNNIEWSDSIYSLLGYKTKSIELDIRTFMNFVANEDRELFQQNINLLKFEEKESSFYFYLLAHGNKKYTEASFKLIRNVDADIFYAVFTDNSQILELKNQLSRFANLSRAIMQNIKEVIFVTDTQNNIRNWNSQSEKIFNKRCEDVLCHNLFQVLPFLKTKDIITGIEAALSGQSFYQPKIHFSDLLKTFCWQMIPVNDPVTGEYQVLHIIQDQDRKLNLNDILNTNRSLIENIVDFSEDRIIALDKNLNYIMWNQKCEEYFKIKKTDVIGRNILEFFPETIDRPTYSEFKSALNGETIYMDILLNNSQAQSLRVYLVPLKDDGVIIGLLWIIKNSTTSKLFTPAQLA